ncbi:hypothetical protein HPB48_018863 [Haemaphysalis longicornis]|uniref:Peptidase M14 domain-containing protein n=1 Tax=Haemaphysalis longicornis TaxID=44386 RepID=A0A9J6G229_HAELO|nr:hypothetical protein HPB48_018863 [Haemaphysalis longicornis]
MEGEFERTHPVFSGIPAPSTARTEMMRLGLLTLQVVSGLYALRSDNGTSDLAYHSRQTQLDTVRRLHSAFPSLSRLEDLGKVAGSPVYVLVISRKPRRQFLVPRVYLLADFPAGSELLLKLASQLLHEHEHDDSVARIINGTEVHILFWPQPEVHATPRDDCSADDKGGELAGFPDYFDGKRAHHPSPKAQLVAHWLRGGRFLLGVHVRGGDGGTAMAYGFHNSVRDEDYEAPDEDVLRNLSLSYVQRQPEMKKGANTCPGGRVKGFPDGVTKAAAWHRKAGLVQDYAYVREGTLVLDLALSCCRVPSEKTLRKLWTDNRRAILHLLLQAERAVRGYVKADDGTHIPGALLTIRGRNIGFRRRRNRPTPKLPPCSMPSTPAAAATSSNGRRRGAAATASSTGGTKGRTRSIQLPEQLAVFRNLKNAKRFAIDIASEERGGWQLYRSADRSFAFLPRSAEEARRVCFRELLYRLPRRAEPDRSAFPAPLLPRSRFSVPVVGFRQYTPRLWLACAACIQQRVH